jgi:hypothetical protein
VRFEPTIPAFERAKTVHALDRAATVIGLLLKYIGLIMKRIDSDRDVLIDLFSIISYEKRVSVGL